MILVWVDLKIVFEFCDVILASVNFEIQKEGVEFVLCEFFFYLLYLFCLGRESLILEVYKDNKSAVNLQKKFGLVIYDEF